MHRPEPAVLQADFEVDDINVVDLEDESTVTVTVHRISTGDSKTYRAGHGSTWVTEFEIDLYEDKFGEP